MALLKQPNAILRLYNEVLEKGITVKESETIPNIIRKCEKRGQFIFCKDGGSFWSFVKSSYDGKKCIRMIFSLKDGEGGKVHGIERIITLISDLEKVLIFVDNVTVTKSDGFIYVDVVKKL